MRWLGVLALVAGVLWFAASAKADCTGSSPTWTTTPDFASLSACVSGASARDTIHVSAGSATWSSTLTITKGVNILGAGVGATIITRGASPMISYGPSTSAHAGNYPLRISGFTFLLGGSGQAINLDCGCTAPIQTRVRIDDDRFENSSMAGGAIESFGCRGVIDSNAFVGFQYPLRVGWGDQCSHSPPGFGITTWELSGDFVYGDASQAMYVEDNTFSGLATAWTDGDQGGSYVMRYNTVACSTEMYPLLDLHGGRGNLWGVRGGEVYGNDLACTGFLTSHRGGRAVVYFNDMHGAGSTIHPYDNDGCPPDPFGANQKMNDSYYFVNRSGTSGALLGLSVGANACGEIVENTTFWTSNPGCTGPTTCSSITTGVGCGTLANRPTMCTVGTGYWATTQSCSDMTGMIGVHPSTPISGTLYRCTAPNTWTAHFSPADYPHPLRTGADPIGVDAGVAGIDAGIVGRIDAGAGMDAGTRSADASTLDAGTLPEDAGATLLDAGSRSGDADRVDASSQDARATAMDAHGEGDAAATGDGTMSGGCGCRVGSHRASGAALAAALLAMRALRSRRKRRGARACKSTSSH